MHIPWATPVFWGNETRNVVDALKSTWISGGPYVQEFEDGMKRRFGFQHALTTSNGTSAIQAAFLALGLRPGDEVIVPGFAFQAAANVALGMGLVPKFAEVNEESWCLTAETVQRLISDTTRCIVAVHTYGNLCPMDELNALGQSLDIPVVEDAAEALGSHQEGGFAGSLGTVGTLSFQATKTLSMGEGGMVACQDDELARKIALFRSHGMGETKYLHILPGNNFRLTNLQAAIGCAQLEHVDWALNAKVALHTNYVEHLSGISGLTFQRFRDRTSPVPWVTAVRVDPRVFPKPRDRIMSSMASEGIETRPGFYAASQMSYFDSGNMAVSELLARQIIVLPGTPTLSNSEVDTICDKFVWALTSEGN